MFGLTATQGRGESGPQQPPPPAAPRDEEFRGEDGAAAILSERQERSSNEEGSNPRTAQYAQEPACEDGGGSGDRDQPDDDIAFHPGLARYGRAMLSGMLRAWWTTWAKRRGPAETDPGTQLAAAARAGVSIRPTGPLRIWLGHLGAEDEAIRELTPEEAARWLAVWRHEQARPLAFNHRRLRAHRGTEALRCGRPTFRQRLSVGALLHEDGQVLTEPGAITEALWQHRADLWTSVPEVTAGARAVLDAYFEQRTAVFPQRPPIGRARLSQLILRGKGSAPGEDQEPYEVYHYGVDFVASLLAQAFHATEMEGGDPDGVLGPSVDLLIWIPKASGT
jgi:hypothetical protein